MIELVILLINGVFMGFFTFFTGWKDKILAGMALIISACFLYVKYLSSKMERVEHENKVYSKKSEIKDAQDKAARDIEIEMQKELKEGIEINDKKSTADIMRDL